MSDRKSSLPAVALVVLAFAGAAIWWCGRSPDRDSSQAEESDGETQAIAEARPSGRHRQKSGSIAPTKPSDAAGDVAAEDEPQTEDEKQEAEEERLVDEFDELTDRWMDAETSAKAVTMADVDAFVAKFSKVPKNRKEECLQRALNLIPDENVMLLAGILMDKSQDKALVELVFNDILNRDEQVKKPIMQQVYRDKTHPCWADTAWILDVTGETPQPQNQKAK